MDLFFGYFDWILLAIIIIINIIYWKKLNQFNSCFEFFAFVSLFGFLLPFISMFIEIKLNSNPGDDAFNLLYTYFRFPVYWIIGIIQLLIILFFGKKKTKK